MADTQTTSARLAQPIRDAQRMAQADGCPSCVANVEAPAHTRCQAEWGRILNGPYYSDDRATLYGGDALAVLAALPSGSVDAWREVRL